MHLVCFIIRIYHDARSPERQLCSFNRMFIGPCIIIIVEELETNLMSLVIFITLNICSTFFEH